MPEASDLQANDWFSRTLAAYPLSAEYIWSWISTRFGPIGSYFGQATWSEEDPVSAAEDQFLRGLRNQYYRYYIETKNGCKIWTLSSVPYPRPADMPRPDVPPVVMIHGLMAGLAYWVLNFDCIVDEGHEVFAIDLPGFARSSRIEFEDDSDVTERTFIELLDEWRDILGIDCMVMVGHSFGGYITTAYAISNPHNVCHIVLVDPWGFPDIKEDVTAVVEYGDSSNFSNPLGSLPIWFRVMVIFLMPFSPFSFIRFAGKRIGPRLIQLLRPDMTRRYECVFGSDDYVTVPNYVYHTNKLNPTGEKAFRNLALPLAWARIPLIKRITKLHPNVAVSFIYGSRSWIDFHTGYEVKEILRDAVVNVHIVNGAGHHIFADQPELFNSLICQILRGDCSSLSTCHRSHIDSSTCSIKDLPIL